MFLAVARLFENRSGGQRYLNRGANVHRLAILLHPSPTPAIHSICAPVRTESFGRLAQDMVFEIFGECSIYLELTLTLVSTSRLAIDDRSGGSPAAAESHHGRRVLRD